MTIIGIIAEYNPFHNGHLYHIQKIKERYPDSLLVLVMGGNFLQRGDPSILDKWTKTEIALKQGVDIVVELPFPFASQSADVFAHGAISLLDALGVERLIFGSETDDVDALITFAKVQLYHPEYRALAKLHLAEGENYPTALSIALEELTGKRIKMPNDILGLSYVKEIIKRQSSIIPETIKRTNDYHASFLTGTISSATAIREALQKGQDVKDRVPSTVYEVLPNHMLSLEDYFAFFKYKVLTEEDLSKYQTVDEGLSQRIKKEIVHATSFASFLDKIKTKRYTYNRLKRMCVHILCNFTKEETQRMQDISYIRVLGFSKAGQQYLNQKKKGLSYPLLTSYTLPENEMLQLELRITSVFASVLDEKEKVSMIKQEYQNPPKRI